MQLALFIGGSFSVAFLLLGLKVVPFVLVSKITERSIKGVPFMYKGRRLVKMEIIYIAQITITKNPVQNQKVDLMKVQSFRRTGHAKL